MEEDGGKQKQVPGAAKRGLGTAKQVLHSAEQDQSRKKQQILFPVYTSKISRQKSKSEKNTKTRFDLHFTMNVTFSQTN